MLLLFLTVIYFCAVYVGQKFTRACVVLPFEYADNKYHLSYPILSYLNSVNKRTHYIFSELCFNNINIFITVKASKMAY